MTLFVSKFSKITQVSSENIGYFLFSNLFRSLKNVSTDPKEESIDQSDR